MFRTLRTWAKMRRLGLTAPVMQAGLHEVVTEDGKLSVGQSRFNPDWLSELSVTPGVIVELGAFDGGDSLRFKTAFPKARVVATDPDSQRVEEMRKSLAGTGVEVRPFRFAEADEAQTLEAFCNQAGLHDIDFLHMDLGGHAPGVISRFGGLRPRLIFMDWCPEGFADGSKPADADDRITRLGYELIADLHQDRLYRFGG